MPKMIYNAAQNALRAQIRAANVGKVSALAQFESDRLALIQSHDLNISRLMNQARTAGVADRDIGSDLGVSGYYLRRDMYNLTAHEFTEEVKQNVVDNLLPEFSVLQTWERFEDVATGTSGPGVQLQVNFPPESGELLLWQYRADAYGAKHNWSGPLFTLTPGFGSNAQWQVRGAIDSEQAERAVAVAIEAIGAYGEGE